MKHISVVDFSEVLKRDAQNPEVAFIDVRTPGEYADGHIEGVKNIPLDELSKRVNELEGKKTVYLQCLSGGRSSQAAQWLEFIGSPAECVNVDGGLMAWDASGLPTV